MAAQGGLALADLARARWTRAGLTLAGRTLAGRTLAGRTLAGLTLAGLTLVSCDATTEADRTAPPSPTSTLPPSAPPPPSNAARFTAAVAADRLRTRAVGWALAAERPDERLANALTALRALPEGHPAERPLLEGLDVVLRAPPPDVDETKLLLVSVAVAERWLARGELGSARALVHATTRRIANARGEARDDLVALVARIDGRAAALALARTTPDAPELTRAIARAEARFGDVRWAEGEAVSRSDVEACRIWNALVVRHTRDGRDGAARGAWEHARRGTSIGPVTDFRALDCMVDLARAATSIGADAEVGIAFAQLPVDFVWPACNVLDALADGFDPLLLDVPLAIVARRREEPGPPAPSCPYTAAWIAARSGRDGLARSLRARAVYGRSRLAGRMGDAARRHLAEVASGEVDLLDAPPDEPFDRAWIPSLAELLTERGDAPIDEARFDARFPEHRAPWADR